MTVDAFIISRIKLKIYYVIVAYTIPLIIVGVTVLTANFLDLRPHHNETSDFNRTGIICKPILEMKCDTVYR